MTKTCDDLEQLRQGTQEVAHTIILKIHKHPIIHNAIQQDNKGIVENINDVNAHLHSAATKQEKIPRDAEDSPTNFGGPKPMELRKDRRVISKHSQDETVVQILDLLKEYQTLFPIEGTKRKEIVEDVERMKIPL